MARQTTCTVGSERVDGTFQRAISLFKDCLTDAETLRTIDDLFQDLGFAFDPAIEERDLAQSTGQRRARAAGYLETLDVAVPEDRARILEAIATKVADWGEDPKWERLTRLHRVLETAGYAWNGTVFEPMQPKPASPAKPTTAEPPPAEPDPGTTGPAVFISYAHEDKEVAHALAAALRARGCRVWIDTEGMRAGDKLIERIAEAIDEVDFLLAIISKASVDSAWCRRELSMAMTGELARKRVSVLPVRLGDIALPPTLKDTFSPSLDPADIEGMADRLVADMTSHRRDSGAFRGGTRPAPEPTPIDVASAPATPPIVAPDEPIRIIGIDTEHVGKPRNDGTRGSALYRVPLRLNRTPSPTWAQAFVAVWDHPPQFSTMHRPGIASVSGDRITLDGTTVEEIERYHAETLRHVIPEVNRRVAEYEAEVHRRHEREDEERGKHDAAIRDTARRISFD